MGVTFHQIGEDEAPVRLDRWLRRHFPQANQAVARKWCRAGQIRVDGKRAEADTRLLAGQSVRVPPMPPDAAPTTPRSPQRDAHAERELHAAILYRDEHLIVLDKPPGLPTQGGPGIRTHLDGMLDALRFDSPHRPRLVHRLDRDTSGALVLARTPAVAARLSASFRGRGVTKVYWAVVAGRPVPVEGVIDLPLKRAPGPRGERTTPAARSDRDSMAAFTEYRTLDHAARTLAWLELTPRTGRTHQLRVHCAALEAPILGDGKYGGEKAHIEGLSDRLHLHARALAFPHPAGGTLEVHAPLPPHMRETFKGLGFAVRATPKPKRA